MRFDAVVLAATESDAPRVFGLTLAERARRVALKAGAGDVFVCDRGAAEALSRWAATRSGDALLVIRAWDQVVHMPLVEPLVHGSRERRIAVDADGALAGALWASGASARELVEALVADPERAEAALSQRWADAERIAHGEVARHPAATARDRRGAARMLLRTLAKSEDSGLARWIYRPISRPLTLLLARTPVTPNQISYVVALMGLLGCWLTAQPGQAPLLAGAALVLAANFVDCCDGELARLRVQASRFGAWLDTITDEATTTLYFVAIGLHAHRARPDLTWIPGTILVGVLAYVATIYVIYYFLVVVSKTGNSQHYVGDLELVDGVLRPRRRGPITHPRLRRLTALLALVVRREFVNLGALALTFFDAYLVLYAVMLAGGVIAAAVVVPEHLKLRGMLRELARRGAAPRLQH